MPAPARAPGQAPGQAQAAAVGRPHLVRVAVAGPSCTFSDWTPVLAQLWTGCSLSLSALRSHDRKRSKSIGSTGSSVAEEEDAKKLEKIAVTSAHAKTFVLHGEDHTLGNAARYMVMRQPQAQFVGYTVPHPSEAKVHLRVQMDPRAGVSAEDGLRKGLEDLVSVCDHLEGVFNAAVAAAGDAPAGAAAAALVPRGRAARAAYANKADAYAALDADGKADAMSD